MLGQSFVLLQNQREKGTIKKETDPVLVAFRESVIKGFVLPACLLAGAATGNQGRNRMGQGWEKSRPFFLGYFANQREATGVHSASSFRRTWTLACVSTVPVARGFVAFGNHLWDPLTEIPMWVCPFWS